MTDHAKKRWAERFSNICPYYEYSLARKPRKSQLSDIHKQCPDHTKLTKMGIHKGTFYKITPHNIVFVCTSEDIIVTVFPYANKASGRGHVKGRTIYRKGQIDRHRHMKHNW